MDYVENTSFNSDSAQELLEEEKTKTQLHIFDTFGIYKKRSSVFTRRKGSVSNSIPQDCTPISQANTQLSTPDNGNMVLVKKKRGRQSESQTNKKHSRTARDNIRRKINIHFINFIIVFLNALILEKKHIQVEKYRNIAYKIKENVSKKANLNYHLKSIRAITEQEVSSMFNCNDPISKNKNKKKIQSLEDIRSILNMKVEEFYGEIFLGNSKEVKKNYGLDQLKPPESKKKKVLPLFFKDWVEQETNQDYKKRLNGEAKIFLDFFKE